jgi:hypothetical protein
MPEKPVGSGYFALAWGSLLLLALAASFFVRLTSIDPYILLQCWLAFAAIILVVWGANRVRNGDKADRKIGQDTINLVVGIVAATAALIALVKG